MKKKVFKNHFWVSESKQKGPVAVLGVHSKATGPTDRPTDEVAEQIKLIRTTTTATMMRIVAMGRSVYTFSL